MDNIQLPYYIKLTIKLLLIFLLGFFVYVGQAILVPLALSILLAIILLPFTNFLERLHFPKVLANLISIILALIFIGGILYFLSSQISIFLRDIPSIKRNLSDHYDTIQNWIQQKLHISTERQTAMINNAAAKVKDSGSVYIGQTFLTITQSVLFIVLIMVYTFFILYYRHMIKRFFFAVFKKAHTPQVDEVLMESKNIIQKYITGLLIEMVIVATANSIVLMIIGIKYAIFFGVFAAILNLIPYIGLFISIAFTALVTFTTAASMNSILWVIIGMEAVHFTDANFLMPNIVGSKVKINPLFSIIGVLIGATLMGIAGIFLALPTIAVLKIIFDRIEELKPWGMLLGDELITPKKNVLQKHALKLKKAISIKTRKKPSSA
jgi:predicted PurR-regulated permease PerM